ncbi:hypothetical protein O4H48_14035 [Rhodobacteraceae bacterium G21628-S1]|nr:hypothetical protein [Rhodobacteraceae bacterium G21628-S1]
MATVKTILPFKFQRSAGGDAKPIPAGTSLKVGSAEAQMADQLGCLTPMSTRSKDVATAPRDEKAEDQGGS